MAKPWATLIFKMGAWKKKNKNKMGAWSESF